MPKQRADISPKRLQAEIFRRGITQRELAERVGTTETTMSRYCNGVRTPRYEILKRIAEELDSTPEYLTGTEGFDNQNEAFSKVRIAIKTYGNKWNEAQKKELINDLLDHYKEEKT